MLSHFASDGAARMVDIGDKAATQRRAVASGLIRMHPETLRLVEQGAHWKGDVLGIARIAAIMGAKRTAELIPLCHPLALNCVEIDLRIDPEASAVHCTATVETMAQTGVEMEALCAVQIGLLTIYDMCKSADRGMSIEQVRLLEKSGGRSGTWIRDAASD